MVESPHCVLMDPEWNPRVSSLLLRRSSRPPLIVVWTQVLCSWRLKKKNLSRLSVLPVHCSVELSTSRAVAA